MYLLSKWSTLREKLKLANDDALACHLLFVVKHSKEPLERKKLVLQSLQII